MDLRQLEYFQTTAKTKNITRAAEQLHVSQSTITLAIQKLEDELGVLLFDRSQKQFSLTIEGLVFEKKVSEALNLLQEGVSEVNNYRQLKKGALKIGVPPMVGAYLFPEILADFKKDYPALQFFTFEEGSIEISRLLENGKLDLGIINLFKPSTAFETVPLTREKFVACLPLSHPLAKQSLISLKDIKDEPFILFKENAYSHRIILNECEKHGFTPNVILSSNRIDTMKKLVEKGAGICFLVEIIARKEKVFASIPLAEGLYLEFGLAWKKEKHLSAAAGAFIRFITESISAAPDIQNPKTKRRSRVK